MRAISVILFAILATLANGAVTPHTDKYADKEFLFKQKAILEVLQHVHQHEVHTQLWEDAKTFKFEENFKHFTNVEAVKEFYSLYKHGLLPFDDIFTVFDETHKKQVVALFHVFFYAEDWDTFYKSMVWARFHVNEGMFIYALTVAVLHRPDMVGIELPAPYEIYPYYFFSSEVIQKAQGYKMQGFYGMKKVEDVYTVVIPANYTGWYVHANTEQKVSYFTEDIGLNSHYYYLNADYPFWMGGKEYNLYKDRRGEWYLYQHQQFLARYYLERLSNDLGLIPEISYYHPIKTGYYPNLRYYNGVYFPARDNYYYIYNEENYYDIEMLEDYERRIHDAIDHGFIHLTDGTHVDLTKPESIEILGNLIQANPDSLNTRFYKYIAVFAKILLGGTFEHFESHKVIPSVLEQFETAMRDPVFYQLYKRIIRFYWLFKDHLPTYKEKEINFPGVTIESVEIDKLITYFDKFDSDITNAVDIEVYDDKITKTELKKFGRIAHYQGQDFIIKARQSRLNHLPFNVKLTVKSVEPVKGVVRAYIGPKYDTYGNTYGINENRENFVHLDTWVQDFVPGKNVIVHESKDFSFWGKDRTTFYDLYKLVMRAYKGETKFPSDQTEVHCGMPSRLMLPKGKKGGMPYQFYFIISPFHEPIVPQHKGYDYHVSCGVGSGSKFVDSLPFGYPFDRKIDETVWFTSNMYYQDVNIYHKYETEVNAVHSSVH